MGAHRCNAVRCGAVFGDVGDGGERYAEDVGERRDCKTVKKIGARLFLDDKPQFFSDEIQLFDGEKNRSAFLSI